MYFENLPLCAFVELFLKLSFANKCEQNLTKDLQFLFLGWYTHHCIAGNPTASLHGLRSSQPQHSFNKFYFKHRSNICY